MRSLMLFAGIVLTSLNTNAQYIDAQYRGQDLVPTNFEIHDMSGQPLPLNDRSNINGSPLFSNIWTSGIIKLSDGKMYFDSSMNYSAYDDELFVKRGTLMYPVNQNVSEFILHYRIDSVTSVICDFKNGFPGIDHNTGSSFYQILSDGKNIQLLKRYNKPLKESFVYGNGIISSYFPTVEYLVYLPRQNKMIELGNRVNLRIIHRKLPQYAASADIFLKKNKVDIKKDLNAVALFKFLDAGDSVQ